MSEGGFPWEHDEVEDDFKAGRFGERGEFEGWPEEAYSNHPMYQMYLEQDRVDLYHELVAGGLSDYEARGTAWPE